MTRSIPTMILLSALAVFPFAASHASEKPNLVLIFIDDMGYGDIGPYGSKLNRTPHLDHRGRILA
jgi:hypothetical protein